MSKGITGTCFFRREGKAMFILKDNETWFSKIQEYTLHPEYEYATYNTIALVELDYKDNGKKLNDFFPVWINTLKNVIKQISLFIFIY